MKQNKYDDENFFSEYKNMERSVKGLESAGEWHVLKELLPELRNKSVLDLGCGFGWHCRYAREQQAKSVIGVDISEKMLQQAREMTNDPFISYIKMPIEDIDFSDSQFDSSQILGQDFHSKGHRMSMLLRLEKCTNPLLGF